jgi:ADP-ribose pyrophosphatase YjhB (NUDIX family)
MQTHLPLAYNHISVDCAIFGYDGQELKVLLIKRSAEDNGQEFHDMKLPGGLIYQDEDLDDAAIRVLRELTGIRTMRMMQFKTYGSKNRTRDPRDVRWLERATAAKVDRIVTVAFTALVKITRQLGRIDKHFSAEWVPIKQVGELAFDHNTILTESLQFIHNYVENHAIYMFELLPRKFTVLQLRTLFEVMNDKVEDVRNFHKRLMNMECVIALDERESGVAHRAARYYRFDKVAYNRTRT